MIIASHQLEAIGDLRRVLNYNWSQVLIDRTWFFLPLLIITAVLKHLPSSYKALELKLDLPYFIYFILCYQFDKVTTNELPQIPCRTPQEIL